MPGLNRSFCWLLPLLIGNTLVSQHEGVTPTATPSPTIDFLRDVRPILAQHCYECHGPDGDQRKGDLRLDVKHEAFAKYDDYAIIVPGDAAKSELLRRIDSQDPDDVMPPPKADDKLKPKDVEILRRWIDSGANWSEHWAFVTPTQPAPPTVGDRGWIKNGIDPFVLAKLEQEGRQPSAQATREAWLRRVTFDLIGLPPTQTQISAFARDKSPKAYEAVVDRLLADERRADHEISEWLDNHRLGWDHLNNGGIT